MHAGGEARDTVGQGATKAESPEAEITKKGSRQASQSDDVRTPTALPIQLRQPAKYDPLGQQQQPNQHESTNPGFQNGADQIASLSNFQYSRQISTRMEACGNGRGICTATM